MLPSSSRSYPPLPPFHQKVVTAAAFYELPGEIFMAATRISEHTVKAVKRNYIDLER